MRRQNYKKLKIYPFTSLTYSYTQRELATLRSALPLGVLAIPLSGNSPLHSVEEPPPSRFNASSPPNTRIIWASSGILMPSAFPFRRPSTTISRIFPSLVSATALRGCLVSTKFRLVPDKSHTYPSFSIKGPEASTVPFFKVHAFSSCLLQGISSSLPFFISTAPLDTVARTPVEVVSITTPSLRR